MSRLFALFLLLCCDGVFARADTFQVFQAGDLGTLTLDENTGIFTAQDITIPITLRGSPTLFPIVFDSTPQQSTVSLPNGGAVTNVGGFYHNATYSISADYLLVLPLANLKGYEGSGTCGQGECGIPPQINEFSLFNYSVDSMTQFPLNMPIGATLTPVASTVPAVTPEPSSLWLLATGSLGIGVALRRRLQMGFTTSST